MITSRLCHQIIADTGERILVSSLRILALAGLVCALAAPAGAQSLDIRDYEAAAACGARSPQVEVTVTGVRGEGILTVELYEPSERHFLKSESRIHRIRIPAETGEQTVCFDLEAPGTYAVAAYEDLDADRDLDQKWNRMPAEPFALSSNEPLRLGFPRFEESAFDVGEDGRAIRLELQEA